MTNLFSISFFRRILLSSLFTLLSGIFLNAQESYSISFQGESIEVLENINSFDWEKMPTSSKYNNGYYGWVQFYQTPDQKTQDFFKSSELQLIDYISNRTYLFYFPETTSITLLRSKGVRAIIPISGNLKMSKDLKKGKYEPYAVEGNNVLVTLQWYKNVEASLIINDLSKLNIKIMQQYEHANLVELSIPQNKLTEISNKPYVKWMELIAPPAVPEDTRGRNLHRSNGLDTQTTAGRNYTGAGIGVLVRDDGTVGPHIDFQGRIDNSAASNTTGTHGDGVAGIMAGAGNLDPTMRGMAAGSDVYVVDYVGSFLDGATQTLINNGDVQITNSSFGDGQNDGYTTRARTVDDQTRTTPSLLHVFSAGNSGTSNFGYGAGAGWGNITGGHKQGKNVIATANVFFDGSLVNSSSRGPATDGRIKPDIAANGQNQISTDPNNTYQTFGGTSGAAPGIAGVSAQLYEIYGNINSGALPESALIKATLLNTANEAGNIGPDYKFGWGIINGWRAGKLIEDGRYLNSTVSQSNANNHIINVPSGTTQVRFMVYWSDPAAAAGATTALINDLDLVVTDPSSTTHLPWVLDPTPNAVNLDTPATNGIDRLNNMEQVLLNNPAAGNYTINITGFNVPLGPQDYYVVYELISEELTLTYPNGDESFVPGETESIYWDAINTTSDFVLEYSTNAGTSWNLIATISGATTNYAWSVPASVTGQALIRITSGSFTDSSDAAFSIASLPSNLVFSQVCPTEATLTWDPVANAESYDVYLLGNKYMTVVANSTTTNTTIPIVDYRLNNWAAVVAKNDTEGWKSRRTIATNHSGGLLNCVINDDISVVSIQNTAQEFLEIGCNGSTDILVSVTIENFGTNAQSNFPVTYQLDSNTVVQETFSGTLNAGQQVSYTFTTPLVIPSNGNYNLTASSALITDQNSLNDSVIFNFDADIDGLPEVICKNATVILDNTGNATITTLDVVDNINIISYTQQAISHSPIAFTGTSVTLGDDNGTAALPLGFNFDFFGETFSQFYIASNGFVSFTGNGMTGVASYSPVALPNSNTPNGMIAVVWDDLSPNIGGTIRYEMIGAAPNRKLLVNYEAVPLYNNPATVTVQLQIHEGTNSIEIHTTNAENNGGNRTQGLEDATGNLAVAVTGKNLTSWTASNEAVRFTPIPGELPDNCNNPVSLSLSTSTFTLADVGDNLVTVTADDGNGGVTTCQATVTVTRDPINFIWESGVWTPQNPSGISISTDTIEVRSAGASLTANSTVGDLTILAGGTLDIGNNELTLSGNLNSVGTLNGVNATLICNGTVDQQITGDFQIGDLVIDNSGTNGVAVQSNVTVLNRLHLVNGILNTMAGDLTLHSDGSNTAMIDQTIAGSVTGEVTVERYIPGKRGYRLVSSAVNSTSSINTNWQEGVHNVNTTVNTNPAAGYGTHITGSTSGANGFDASLTGNPSMFTFDNVNQSWETVLNTDTDNLIAGKPYRLYVRGSRAVDLNSTPVTTADATTLRAKGTLQIGDVPFTNIGDESGEFNFIGNPYQASVDMNAVMAASTNINNNFYYLWDPQIGARGAYATITLPSGTNTSSSAANQYLQPGQAAFLATLANGTGEVRFQETQKVLGHNTATFSTPVNNSSIVGQLFRNENGIVAPAVQDSFGIFFDTNANSGIDAYDASKIYNQDETIAVQHGLDLLAVDRRPLPLNDETIYLSHLTYRSTDYQYKFEINNVMGKQVYLEDTFLNTSTLLNDGVNYYNFSVDASTDSSASNRFSLKVEEQTLGLQDHTSGVELRLIPNPVSTDLVELVVDGININNDTSVVIYNLTGQRLLEYSVSFSNNKAQLEGLSKLATGTYFLNLKSHDLSQTIKFIKK